MLGTAFKEAKEIEPGDVVDLEILALRLGRDPDPVSFFEYAQVEEVETIQGGLVLYTDQENWVLKPSELVPVIEGGKRS